MNLWVSAQQTSKCCSRPATDRVSAAAVVTVNETVTGCFLVISLSSYILNESGFTCYQQLIPQASGVSDACDDPCVCDGDGEVGGVYTNKEGGCRFRDTIPSFLVSADTSSLTVPLCMVPSECSMIGNSTDVIRRAINDPGWEQGSIQYRVCEIGEPSSDVCDPGSDQVKSNTYSFIVVFFSQVTLKRCLHSSVVVILIKSVVRC